MMENNNGRMISLNGNNWQIWKAKMEDLLYSKDLYDPIDGKKPEDMSEDDWKKENQKVVACIRQWLDDVVFHHVSNEISAESLWKKLHDLYERKTAGNKAFLIRKLVNLKYKESGTGTIGGHLNEMQSIVNQLASMEMVLDDELQALLLLSSLPESWETLVVSLSNSSPNGKLTMSQVTSNLFNEEVRRKSSSEVSTSSQALVSEE